MTPTVPKQPSDEADSLTFEQALENLEQIVERIEQGEVPLEESIEKYAEGIALVKKCRTILDGAEKKIQLLSKGAGETDLVAAGELDDPDGDDAGA